MFRSAEDRSEPALPAAAVLGLAVIAVSCGVGCALLAAYFSGFPSLVFGVCACVLALAAAIALVVQSRRRGVGA